MRIGLTEFLCKMCKFAKVYPSGASGIAHVMRSVSP
jgi:hypothetical protein